MSRLFDWTVPQLRFVAVLTTLAVVMGGYLLIKTYAIPRKDSPALQVYIGSDDRALSGSFVLDPNTAPADSLELLPGIGPVLADRIIAYRHQHRFEKEIDITEVQGIGPKLYERLRPYLAVSRE